MAKEYGVEVIAAAMRVARIFADGCDRCNAEDLALLERAELMTVRTCDDAAGQDSLEVGELMWTFNSDGQALADTLLSTETVAR